jgi:hypothetical protein
MQVCSVTWGLLNAVLVDRFQHRSTLLLFSIAVGIMGLAMAGWDTRRHVRLAGLFLAHMSLPCLMFVLIFKRVLARTL